MKVIDISGVWRYAADLNGEEIYKSDISDGEFILPGSACGNKIGKKCEYFDELTREAVRAPRERYEYIAPLWLEREVTIPEELENKRISLFLERVNISSDLWVDGVKTGKGITELSVPHVYDLTGKIGAGKHTLTLRIDNRDCIGLETMASGYSIDTQGIWNGAVGKIELRFEEIFSIANAEIYPRRDGIDVRIIETSDVRSPFETKKARLHFTITDPDGKIVAQRETDEILFNSRQAHYESFDIGNPRYWDEFNPVLYTLTVGCEYGKERSEKSFKFGMRTIKTENKRILLNDRQISLRGTIDCAQFPLTGYPPTDEEFWKKRLKIIKEFGLNHVRFHAWCPPDAAFCAADDMGVYLSVEMPMWLNKDVCASEVGDERTHRSYFTAEALAISKTYGNHPSFLMFSNGNENMGDFELLEDIIIQLKSYDNRRIYTLTTNFDHPVMPCEDYLCAYEAGGHKVRMQDIHDIAAQSTRFDYSDAVSEVPVPVISFETGQYCVYPDVEAAAKYTGNMVPENFDAIEKHMIKKGVRSRLHDYIAASGDLAVKLYKEEIEAVMRTRSMGGFELLSLCDYTGQSTATVGILDVFFENKGLIGAAKFKSFCGEVVPLFKSERLFKSTDILEAELDLYDFGKNPATAKPFHVRISCGGDVIYDSDVRGRHIGVPLDKAAAPAALRVEVSAGEYSNSWRVYVFDDKEPGNDSKTIHTAAELLSAAREGGKWILAADSVKNPIEGGFIPVFWSPVHFPTQRACGAIIDSSHPVFKYFPTGKYPDYQWKTLLEHSVGMEISGLEEICPIVEPVPNFADNTPRAAMFEARVGKADILYCGFDLGVNDIAVRQLKRSIFAYVQSGKFLPHIEVAEEKILRLLK